MTAAEENETMTTDFQPISVHSLRTNTVTNFDIYIKLSNRDHKRRFVLYRRKNIPFLERIRENLADHGTDILYIDASDKNEYQLYIERNLESIIQDEEISSVEKASLAYSCATGLVEGLLENPRSGEHVKRSKTFISNLVEYILEDSQAFFNLMASISFDYYTYTHSVNVAVFGIALAHRLGQYTRETIETIGSGFLLHDVGKGLIDNRILNKKGPLNESEWTVIKEHPENGVKLLRNSEQVSEQALSIVEGHHEKLDGSGYPHGLSGNEINQYARMAAIVDIFDAITTRRAYRPAEPAFHALEIMRNEMMAGLDPDLFREFVLLLGDQPRDGKKIGLDK